MGNGTSRKKENMAIERSTRNFNHHSVCAPFGSTNVEHLKTISVGVKKLINIIWFDSRSVPQDDIIDTQITKKTLSTALRNAELTCFSNTNSCIEFLRQHQDTVGIVFLVISGHDSVILFNALSTDLSRSIDSIFIFCLSKKLYEAHLLYQKKVVGIYCEHHELLQSIQEQAVKVGQHDLLIKFYTDTQKTARIVPNYAKGEFVWIRALKEASLQIERTEKIMRQMYDRFRILYRRDIKELEKIDEFENTYSPDDAIKWYTKDSFLYRIINQSLRTENTNELITFSPYIADLCHAVRAIKTKVDKAMTFFRGCTLNKTALDEFHSNIGSLLSINTFFSASRRRDVAKMFAGCHDMSGTTTLVSILFEIEVREGTQSCFADISELSLIEDEREVLFDLNAVFMIHNVTYSDVDECWIIHLVADEETYVKHEYLYQELREIYNLNASPFITVGLSLIMIGNTQEAYRYAVSLPLSYNPTSGFNLLFTVACIVECDYSRALKFLKRTYEYCEKSSSFEVHHGWTYTPCWIADILIGLGELRIASQYVQSIVKYYTTVKQSVRSYKEPMSLEYLRDLGSALETDDEVTANRMLLLYVEVEKMQPVKRALILPATHTRLARSYVNVNCLQEAFNHLREAEIEGELLLSDRALVRQGIYLIYACIYLYIRKFDVCSSYLSQAERIARMNLSRSSPSNLGCVFLLREIITILQENVDSKSYLPLARIAFLRTENYIDVPTVAFVLSNLCKFHNEYRNDLNSSVLAKLGQFLKSAFQIYRFEQILEGKSPENIYRPLLNYIQQIETLRTENTQAKQREKNQITNSNHTIKKLNI